MEIMETMEDIMDSQIMVTGHNHPIITTMIMTEMMTDMTTTTMITIMMMLK